VSLEQRRSASGLDLHVHTGDGSGAAPIIALHPWFGCWQFWLPVVELMPERDWVLVDMYSGAGTIPADDGAFDALAAAVTSAVEEYTDQPVVLMGNSTGGLLAQVIAIAGRPPLDSLVLVGTGATAAGVKAPFRATLGEWLDAGGSAAPASTAAVVRSLVYRDPPADDMALYAEAVETADYPFLSAVLRGVLGGDVVDRLPQISVPTLVIRGAEDAARTGEHVATLMAGIPDCRAVEIPLAGHSPQVDTPAEVAAAMRDLLRDRA
jgi:pimeloyl-ACP methyl ester carboxylesterase